MVATGAERVDWVDVAKGICIVFVVMMHSTLGVEKAAGETGFMGLVVAFAQPFRMPDFFLISGLFLSRVIDRDWRTFIDRRIIHFFYFYVLWLTIQFAFKAPGMAAEFGLAETLRLYVASLFWEPFGTLWFIWILPFFALAIRLTRKLPMPLVFALAALMEIAPIHTGWVAVDEFASRFVYFYAGYALAPQIFRLAAAAGGRPLLAVCGLLVWGLVNGVAVFSGYADLPVFSLLLGALGASAVVSVAAIADRAGRIGDLFRHLGANSIVVYLAFFLPMAVGREILLRTGVIPDVGVVSLLVTLGAVAVPFLMKAVADRLGLVFLFDRPAWAKLDRPAPRRFVGQPAE